MLGHRLLCHVRNESAAVSDHCQLCCVLHLFIVVFHLLCFICQFPSLRTRCGQFQQENVQLLERLHDVSDEVRQIQHKVVHIAELQSIFTEKVLEQVRSALRCVLCACVVCTASDGHILDPSSQAGNIDLVFDNTVQSTENVRAGNEEIRDVRHIWTWSKLSPQPGLLLHPHLPSPMCRPSRTGQRTELWSCSFS